MSKETKTERINFLATPTVKKFIDRLAKDFDRTNSYVIHELLQYFVDNPPKSLPVRKQK